MRSAPLVSRLEPARTKFDSLSFLSMAMTKYSRVANKKYPLVANKRAPLVAK